VHCTAKPYQWQVTRVQVLTARGGSGIRIRACLQACRKCIASTRL